MLRMRRKVILCKKFRRIVSTPKVSTNSPKLENTFFYGFKFFYEQIRSEISGGIPKEDHALSSNITNIQNSLILVVFCCIVKTFLGFQ